MTGVKMELPCEYMQNSLLSLNYNQLLDEVFVILGIIKAKVSDINQAEGQGR